MRTTPQQRYHTTLEGMKSSLNALESKLASEGALDDKDFLEAKLLADRAREYGVYWIVFRVEKFMFLPDPRHDAGKILTKGGKAMRQSSLTTFAALFGKE